MYNINNQFVLQADSATINTPPSSDSDGIFSHSHGFAIDRANFYDFQNYHYHAGDGSGMQHSEEVEHGLEVLRQAIWIGASHDSAERFPASKCDPGTRDEVLGVLTRWAEGHGRSRRHFMWVNGSSIAGKSTIAQTIVEDFQSRGMLGASFFFPDAAKDPERIASSFMPTIAYQLAQNVPELRFAIAQTIIKDTTILSKSIEAQLEKLVFNPLRKLDKPLELNRVIVIDGLDKCDSKDTQRNIIRSLAFGVHSNRDLPIRFMVFSRPEKHLRNLFTEKRGPAIPHAELPLDERYPVDEEIKKYLRAGFNKIYEARKDHMRVIRPPWPPDSELDWVVQKTRQHFCCATAILRVVGAERFNPNLELHKVLFYTDPSELDPHFSQQGKTSSRPSFRNLWNRYIGTPGKH